MKPVTFKNRLNGERVICSNPKTDIEVIDGVEYYMVHRHASDRCFLMRKDALEKVKEEKVKMRP